MSLDLSCARPCSSTSTSPSTATTGTSTRARCSAASAATYVVGAGAAYAASAAVRAGSACPCRRGRPGEQWRSHRSGPVDLDRECATPPVWHAGGMDDVSWGALALALTLVGGTYTWYAYQRRGLGAGARGAAITLLPLAAYLTKTLRMFTRIADAIGDWATSLVFSPAVWLGIVVAGSVGAALRRLAGRRAPQPAARRTARDGRRARAATAAGAQVRARRSSRGRRRHGRHRGACCASGASPEPTVPAGVARGGPPCSTWPRARPATLGAGRLLCVDGPAGSGKTTLAAAVAAPHRARPWSTPTTCSTAGPACPASPSSSTRCCCPLAAGEAGPLPALRLGRRALRRDRRGRARRRCWCVEGVGSGPGATPTCATVLVWVEVDATCGCAAGWRATARRCARSGSLDARRAARTSLDEGTRARADVVV